MDKSTTPYTWQIEAIRSGNTDKLGHMFTEVKYYIMEAHQQGIRMPMLEGLFDHAQFGNRVIVDGQSRVGPNLFSEYMRKRD